MGLKPINLDLPVKVNLGQSGKLNRSLNLQKLEYNSKDIESINKNPSIQPLIERIEYKEKPVFQEKVNFQLMSRLEYLILVGIVFIFCLIGLLIGRGQI
jgi:hypothetical protein